VTSSNIVEDVVLPYLFAGTFTQVFTVIFSLASMKELYKSPMLSAVGDMTNEVKEPFRIGGEGAVAELVDMLSIMSK
jgi:hypothetical protein